MSVAGDDADVAVGDEDGDGDGVVRGAEADVVEALLWRRGDAAAVDDVAAMSCRSMTCSGELVSGEVEARAEERRRGGGVPIRPTLAAALRKFGDDVGTGFCSADPPSPEAAVT